MRPCCFSLIIAVQIVAIVSIILDVGGLALFIINLNSIASFVAEENLTESSEYTTFNILSLVLAIIGTLVHFALSILLFRGARNHDVSKCRIWCYATLVLFVLIVLTNLSGIKLAVAGAVILLYLYFLWVVYAHIQELKMENVSNLSSSRPYSLFT